MKIVPGDLPYMLKNEDTIMALESNLMMIHILKERIKQVEKRIRQRIQLKPEFKKLLTVSGIGTILALTVMLETGEIRRFPSVSDFVSYCQNAPVKKHPMEERKERGTAKW